MLPQSVTKIERNAFSDCSKLTRRDIHAGITEIGVGIFSGCESLSEILLSTVEVIEEDAFYGCGDIEIKINKPEGSVTGAPWRADDAKVIWAK